MEMPYLGAQYRPRMFAPQEMPLMQPQMLAMPQPGGGMMQQPNAPLGSAQGAGTLYGGGGEGGSGSSGNAANKAPQAFGGGDDDNGGLPPAEGLLDMRELIPGLAKWFPNRSQPVPVRKPESYYLDRNADIAARSPEQVQRDHGSFDAFGNQTGQWDDMLTPDTAGGYGKMYGPVTREQLPDLSVGVNPRAAGNGGMLDRVGEMLGGLAGRVGGGMLGMGLGGIPGALAGGFLGERAMGGMFGGGDRLASLPAPTSQAVSTGWSQGGPEVNRLNPESLASLADALRNDRTNAAGGAFPIASEQMPAPEPTNQDWLDKGWYLDDSGTWYKD